MKKGGSAIELVMSDLFRNDYESDCHISTGSAYTLYELDETTPYSNSLLSFEDST